jgi:hypothetical protein
MPTSVGMTDGVKHRHDGRGQLKSLHQRRLVLHRRLEVEVPF